MAWKRPQIPNFKEIVRAAAKEARVTAIDSIKEHADAAREDFQMRIWQQRFRSFEIIFYPESGTNLSPQWLRRKELAGADERTMIATGHYVESIKTFTKGRLSRGPFEVRIGFAPNAKARKLDGSNAKILLRDVARIQEFGSVTANIPPRPHWGPYGNRMRKDAPAVRQRISKLIGVRLFKVLPKYAKKRST